MTLYEQIEAVYPNALELIFSDVIILQNDSDGKGDYIAKWDYEKPLPEGLVVGKAER